MSGLTCLFQGIAGFRKPLVIVIIGGLGPPVQKLVQRLDILFDTGASVLFRVSVDRYDMTVILLKVNLVNAVSRPAAVCPESGSLHIPEPLVLHGLRNIAATEYIHFLIADRPLEHEGLMLPGHGLGSPVRALGNFIVDKMRYI